MDKENLDHIIELHKKHRSRLYVLEEREALLGFSTPAEVITEIRLIRTKVAELEQQIKAAQNAQENLSGRHAVEIRIGGSLDKWTSDMQETTLKILAAVMDITPDRIRILRVADGSIVLLISVSHQAVIKLLAAYKAKEIPSELPIESVRIIDIEYKFLGAYSEIKSDLQNSPMNCRSPRKR